jgi:uncharacterized protein involved in response to NO
MSKLMSNGQIVEREPLQGVAFLRLAFRPFFLLGALFGMVGICVWGAIVTGHLQLSLYGGGLWWHVHEMLFGFVCAIAVGFLLTAVQTWTGVAGIKGTPLAMLVGLWLLGRVLMFLGAVLPGWVIALVDVLFLPVAAAVLVAPIVQVKQWRNIVFLPVLLLMIVANTVMHWAVLGGDPGLQPLAGNAMVLLVTLLMTIVAGRVVPMFTANGTKTERVPPLPWLEKACIPVMVLALLAGLAQHKLPPELVAVIFLMAAFVHALRVLRWRLWVTLRTPLVWTLHLSYWSIPLGLLLFGLGQLGVGVSQTQAIHTLTVGGMGMMILAMISRVSLGHTGREIVVGRVMTGAFLAMYAAFLVRVFGVYLFSDYSQLLVTAVCLWLLAYGCFFALYLPVLARSRIDGRPG